MKDREMGVRPWGTGIPFHGRLENQGETIGGQQEGRPSSEVFYVLDPVTTGTSRETLHHCLPPSLHLPPTTAAGSYSGGHMANYPQYDRI